MSRLVAQSCGPNVWAKYLQKWVFRNALVPGRTNEIGFTRPDRLIVLERWSRHLLRKRCQVLRTPRPRGSTDLARDHVTVGGAALGGAAEASIGSSKDSSSSRGSPLRLLAPSPGAGLKAEPRPEHLVVIGAELCRAFSAVEQGRIAPSAGSGPPMT